jgi:hypothetical protein
MRQKVQGISMDSEVVTIDGRRYRKLAIRRAIQHALTQYPDATHEALAFSRFMRVSDKGYYASRLCALVYLNIMGIRDIDVPESII